MRTLRKLFMILLIGSIGCAPKYIPSVVNVPVLKNKGEIQASVCQGTSSFSPQLSYAVTDNIGVMLNGSFANQDSTPNEDMYKIRYGELGAGHYQSIGKRGMFNVYGGYGFGTIRSTYSDWPVEAWNSESDFVNHRFFVQPSIGLMHEVIDLNFATKFSYTFISKNAVQESSFFITPVANFKVGYKYAKFLLQMGASIKTGQNSAALDYNPFVINIGMQIDLFQKYD